MIKLLEEKIKKHSYDKKIAIIFLGKSYSYHDLLNRVQVYDEFLLDNKIKPGATVLLFSDYSFESISLFISLCKNKNTIVPLVDRALSDEEIRNIVGADWEIRLNNGRDAQAEGLKNYEKCPLLMDFLKLGKPGLILFSSGSTGKPKAILHDFDRIFKKYIHAQKSLATLLFFLFDHIAGLDTLFYTIFAGGTLVIPEKREPGHILKLIEELKVEVLPTSPSFINFMLLTEDCARYNLGSLKFITFGAERMPESTLRKMKEVFQNIKIIQKYGATEFGSPISQSKGEDPFWIKLDKSNCDYKIVDSRLFVKTQMSMVGYLNREKDPVSEGGWIDTGDQVEVDGEWLRILGRKSELINVGGRKLYPAEVESILLEIYNIADVTVFAQANPIMGNVVGAKVSLERDEALSSVKKRIRNFCKDRLESFKVPAHIEITPGRMVSQRFKRSLKCHC